ncbi:hypothetical protein BDV32DRAFT_130635 [Aspergillus pseudonomiae]|uniref:Uncharacterized protein n=1 Tax=Aspergillus pseudonomiae TaxID=1506151 RepID=A0A5N7DJW3_9EURO|nr:uncharacterized protein BDV37DRAFT_242443 [Aspergillus pseudonomiae]KAB8255457.1 hypothetical protein BDV32DRAFT_130635 [Aspergillus pseudonomiae]KAE8406726.1 hypothetical protein BDV37DRAFT_242443 [Aspergillus pseudonomiae]
MNPLRYLAPPRPFTEISTSTSKEIKERISYVDSMKANPHFNISEEREDALLDYLEACASLTEGPASKEEREAAHTCIRGYEKSLENNEPARLSFDLATKTKLGEELDNLWNMWTFNRYENYLPEDIIKEAQHHPSSQVSDPWHREFWRPFNGRLEAEKAAFDKVLVGQNHHNECPTFLLLALLCERHTLDWDETLELIKACARDGDKLELPAVDLVEFLKKRDVTGLATRLDRDEASISLSTEYVMGVGSLVLAFFASHLPEFLFDRDEVDPADWTPKEPLKVLLDLDEAHEQAFRFMMQEMFNKMADGDSDEDGDDVYDDWDNDDDDDDDDIVMSDESEDY